MGGAILSQAMGTKQRKALRDPEAGVRKLARLFSEEIARLMAERLAAMSEESIRAIVRNCSRVALPESLPQRPKPLHVRVRRERLGPATGTANVPTSLSRRGARRTAGERTLLPVLVDR